MAVKRIQEFLKGVVLEPLARQHTGMVVVKASAQAMRRAPCSACQRLVVQCVYFNAPDVGVLSVLMVLLDMHLHHPAAEGVAVCASAAICNWDVLPPHWVGKGELCKLNQVMVSGTGAKHNMGWRVGFVLVVVDVEANCSYLHAA